MRLTYYFLSLLFLLCACSKDEEPELITPPEQNEYNYSQPQEIGDGWETENISIAGFDLSLINQLGNRLKNYSYPHIHSVLIIKDSKLVFEEYYHGYNASRTHDLRSATKSITAMLTGIAIEKGFINSVDDAIIPYFPEYTDLENLDSLKRLITVKDLLCMR